MEADREFFVFFLSCLILSSLFSVMTVSSYFEDDASESVEAAELAVSSAFEAVLDAERVGADVSGLIGRLNEAASFLGESEVRFRVGDYDGAVEAADRSVQIAEFVKGEAYGLRLSSLAQRALDLRFRFLISFVCVSVFLALMFLIWFWFKGYYVRRLLGLRPEVKGDVES